MMTIIVSMKKIFINVVTIKIKFRFLNAKLIVEATVFRKFSADNSFSHLPIGSLSGTTSEINRPFHCLDGSISSSSSVWELTIMPNSSWRANNKFLLVIDEEATRNSYI